MALKDFGNLFKPENKLYLVLVLWILIGYAVFQFFNWTVGAIIFLPLIGLCIILLIVALISRKPVNETSKKMFILPIIVAVVFLSLFVFIAMGLFIIGIISYIFITAIFIMLGFFDMGMKIDKKVSNGVMRAGIFIGGIAVSILALYFSTDLLGILFNVEYNPMNLSFGIIIVIIAISVLGLIFSLRRKKLPVWMGVFFLGVAIYAIYLNYSVLSDFAEQLNPEAASNTTLILFFLNLFLLIYTISGIVGEKVNTISAKARIFGFDTVLIWLIFATASYELAKGMPTMNVTTLKSIIVLALFIPLSALMGLYGILRYKKLTK